MHFYLFLIALNAAVLLSSFARANFIYERMILSHDSMQTGYLLLPLRAVFADDERIDTGFARLLAEANVREALAVRLAGSGNFKARIVPISPVFQRPRTLSI